MQMDIAMNTGDRKMIFFLNSNFSKVYCNFFKVQLTFRIAYLEVSLKFELAKIS